jgi:GT2 family glycosyltransferase
MISIIIANYNRKDMLEQCLNSIRCQDFKDFEIIVVDNASTDGSVEMIGTYYPEVKLIRNAENLLFCKAQNQGIGLAKGDFILCLNSDCVLDKDYLKEAFAAACLDGKIGMVSGKILRTDRKTVDSTGLFLGRNRKAVERGYGKEDKGQYNEAGYVFGVSGAAAFLRKSMLMNIKDKNGYFDERFGMYYEDLDLCWRARKKGWKAYYEPKAIAYHARSGIAALRGNKDLTEKYILNRYMCMRKNDSIWGVLLNSPFILLYEIKISFYAMGNFLLTRAKRHSII